VRYLVSIDGRTFDVEIVADAGERRCRLNGHDVRVDFIAVNANAASLLIRDKSYAARRDSGSVWIGQRRYEVSLDDPRSWQGRRRRQSVQTGPQRLTASMPGKIVRILAGEGDNIQLGQGIVVVEAMKMQNEIKSGKSGRLQKLLVRQGANVNPGDVLAIVE